FKYYLLWYWCCFLDWLRSMDRWRIGGHRLGGGLFWLHRRFFGCGWRGGRVPAGVFFFFPFGGGLVFWPSFFLRRVWCWVGWGGLVCCSGACSPGGRLELIKPVPTQHD